MEQVTNQVVQLLVQVVVLVGGVFASVALHKGQAYLAKLGESKKTALISDLAYNVANLAEAQLSGKAGSVKLSYALQELSKILGTKGIQVSDAELHAAIETAVAHLPQDVQPLVAPAVAPVAPAPVASGQVTITAVPAQDAPVAPAQPAQN